MNLIINKVNRQTYSVRFTDLFPFKFFQTVQNQRIKFNLKLNIQKLRRTRFNGKNFMRKLKVFLISIL